MAHRVELTPEAQEHIAGLRAHDRALVLDEIVRQLVHQPTVGTKKRKRMRPNMLAQYRLRVAHLRVYYDVADGPEPLVLVKGIAIKDGDRVLMGGVEIKL